MLITVPSVAFAPVEVHHQRFQLDHQVRYVFIRFSSYPSHYSDVIMSAMASQITGVTIVYSIVCSGAYQRKQQSYASLAFVGGIHRWPVNSPHKGPVTRKRFPFDDVIMTSHWWFLISVPDQTDSRPRSTVVSRHFENCLQGPLFLIWIISNPSMDK